MAAKKSLLIDAPEHLANTIRLSAAEHGAYVRLLLSYWQDGPLHDDDAVLARITGTTLSEWKKVRPAIQDFFDVADGLWNPAGKNNAVHRGKR